MWVDHTGAEHWLTDPLNGRNVLWGATGLGFMPVEVSTVPAAARAGSILTGVAAREREVFVPLLLTGDSFFAVRRRLADLARVMDPRDGDGALKLVYPDGSGRRLVCRYRGGLEGSEGDDAWDRELRVGLTFVAPDPAWLDLEPFTLRWVLGAATPFFPLSMPLVLSASSVLGNVTIDVQGDEDCYPVWTITGPATSVTLTNDTTGKTFTINAALEASDTVVVDTRPDQLTVIGPGDTNMWPDLDPNPVLWALRPGVNAVDLNLAGAAAGSSVRLDTVPRYKTAW